MEIIIADHTHTAYAQIICDTIEKAAQTRGTGIARRKPTYIISKMKKGNAVIALDKDKFAGFCYIETWSHGKFVANSGLIVHPDYRGQGLATKIKLCVFEHSRTKFPNAKIFSITTGLAVMKLNSNLGYTPVTFSELTKDQTFWDGCQTCKNFDVLKRTQQTMCLCTGMLYDPSTKSEKKQKKITKKAFTRLKSIKQTLFLKNKKK